MFDDLFLKPLVWIGTSKKDFTAFPDIVKSEAGYALFVAQCGGKHEKAKVLSGFGSAGIVEIVNDHRGDTFRTIYTVRFASAIYVLHAFQKKSKKGIATVQSDLRTVERRLREAQRLHEEYGNA